MAGIFQGLGNIFTGKGGGPSYPAPSSQEKGLAQSQADLLNQYKNSILAQTQQQNLLSPLIYQQLGITPQYELTGTQEIGADGQLHPQDRLTGYSYSPTSQQVAAQDANKAQLDAYNQQLQTQKILQPYALKQLGYDPQYDEQGNLIGLTERQAPVDPLDQQRRDLEGQFLTRTQQALQGQLPVDPALQRQFSEQEAQLRSQLQAQLGPGYETSTPGIQALAQFNQRKAETLYGAQHGEIGSSAALALGTQQGNIAGTAADQRTLLGNLGAAQGISGGVASTAQLLSPYASLGTAQNQISTLVGGLSAPFSSSAQLGSLAQLYGGSLPYYQKQGQLNYTADYNQDQNNQNNMFWRNLGASAGSTLGKGAGGGFA